jgi:hypothetical protein
MRVLLIPFVLIATLSTSYAKIPGFVPFEDSDIAPSDCTSTAVKEIAVGPAIVSGDTETVKSYFGGWRKYFSFLSFDEMIALSLKLALQQPAEITGDTVDYLITKVRLEQVTPPNCRLASYCFFAPALENGHINMLAFLAKNFCPDMLEWALWKAVNTNDKKRAVLLLKAGVNSNVGINPDVKRLSITGGTFETTPTYSHYLLHEAVAAGRAEMVRVLLAHGASAKALDHVGFNAFEYALRAFQQPLDNSELANRLYILRRLLASIDAPYIGNMRANVCDFDEATRQKVLAVLETFNFVTETCQNHDG